MIGKMKSLQRIMDTGIIAVIRGDTVQKAVQTAEAVKEGGIDIIEITMTVPGAMDVLPELRQRFSEDEVVLGAGTVLDPETTRLTLLAGAEFVVSPGLNPEVVKMCNRYQVLNMAGSMTVNEVINALEAGTDVVKFFPGNLFGPQVIKTLKGPLPQAEFIPTGGVNLDNVQEWLRLGCLAVGVGSDLTKGAEKEDYEEVTRNARAFREKIKEIRKG